MKYLLLIAIVLLVLWLWRGEREEERGARDAQRRPPPPGRPQDMIECPVCHVHLPRSDALPGPDGQFYCCAEHRARSTA